MTLSDIENKILELPTIMDIGDEILLINALMNIPPKQLSQNQKAFSKVINAIELAHTDSGFMELDHENEYIFKSFSNWLIELNQEYGFQINENIIENFGLTVDKIKKLMP